MVNMLVLMYNHGQQKLKVKWRGMKKLLHILAALSVLALTVFVGSQVNAQSAGVGINPRIDHTIRPGETATGRLLVSNLNRNVPLKVNIKIVDFSAYDDTGTPKLMTAENAEQTAWSLKPYLSLPQSVDVAPGESKYIDYSIKIPQNVGAGSYYSAVQYQTVGADGGNVALNAAPTTLAFVTVPGRASELLVMEKFGAFQTTSGAEGSFRSFFITKSPQKLAYRLTNNGSVAESPKGSIIVKNIFGKEVLNIPNANPKDNLALIGQTRRFEVCLKSTTSQVQTENGQRIVSEDCEDPKLAPGIYTATMALYYGLNGNNTQEINATTTFWYMPLWFIGIIVVILAGIAGGIFFLRKKLIGGTTKTRRRK